MKLLIVLICSLLLICGCENKEQDKISIDELTGIKEKIGQNITLDYTNLSDCYIDESKNLVVVELINNSEEEQKWFRENIYNSEYIVFAQKSE